MMSDLGARPATVGIEPTLEWRGKSYYRFVLLHFDIRSTDERTRRRVDRFLYGYQESRLVGGSKKVYRYPGLIERTQGCHYGQSVVILSATGAEEALDFLHRMNVPFDKVEILASDFVHDPIQ